MSLDNSAVYLVGAALIVLALLLGRPQRGHSLRARDISGNTLVGNVSGSVSQGAAPPPAAPPPGADPKNRPDKVAWIIAVIGVLIALGQLGHDLLAGK